MAEDRMRVLVEAGIAVSSELSLDAVLQKIVESAAELTGARYAALGVINEDRSGLERFVGLPSSLASGGDVSVEAKGGGEEEEEDAGRPCK